MDIQVSVSTSLTLTTDYRVKFITIHILGLPMPEEGEAFTVCMGTSLKCLNIAKWSDIFR